MPAHRLKASQNSENRHINDEKRRIMSIIDRFCLKEEVQAALCLGPKTRFTIGRS